METRRETITDIIAEKRREAERIRNNLSTVPVRQWEQEAEIKSMEDEADRLEAALRREREESGNAAAVREALKAVKRYFDGYTVNVPELLRTVDAALSATERKGGAK